MTSAQQTQRVLILQSSKAEGSLDGEEQVLEEQVTLEEGMDHSQITHEEVVQGDGQIVQEGLVQEEEMEGAEFDEDGQRRPNYGAKKRLIERNEERRQLVGEPPEYTDVALSFDDVETLLLYPETITADKVGFTVPSGNQMGDATFIVSLRSLASPKDIRSDALGKWSTSSTLSRYYQVTGDTFARVDRGGRAPHPDDPWDIKIMNTYSRNPSAGKKLKKNIYERYEASGRMGPFAVITYVWDPDVTPFRFEILPHGNKKYNGTRLSRAIQLPPEEALRYNQDSFAADESIASLDTGPEETISNSLSESAHKPSRFTGSSRSSFHRPGPGRPRLNASNKSSPQPAKRSRPDYASSESKERLECDVLTLQKEKLRMEVHRMAAETDKEQ